MLSVSAGSCCVTNNSKIWWLKTTTTDLHYDSGLQFGLGSTDLGEAQLILVAAGWCNGSSLLHMAFYPPKDSLRLVHMVVAGVPRERAKVSKVS